MTLHREIAGKTDDCLNCLNIAKGEEEGTCLCCGAVWSHVQAKPSVPTFAGETNVETVAGSPYRSAYSFRVF